MVVDRQTNSDETSLDVNRKNPPDANESARAAGEPSNLAAREESLVESKPASAGENSAAPSKDHGPAPVPSVTHRGEGAGQHEAEGSDRSSVEVQSDSAALLREISRELESAIVSRQDQRRASVAASARENNNPEVASNDDDLAGLSWVRHGADKVAGSDESRGLNAEVRRDSAAFLHDLSLGLENSLSRRTPGEFDGRKAVAEERSISTRSPDQKDSPALGNNEWLARSPSVTLANQLAGQDKGKDSSAALLRELSVELENSFARGQASNQVHRRTSVADQAPGSAGHEKENFPAARSGDETISAKSVRSEAKLREQNKKDNDRDQLRRLRDELRERLEEQRVRPKVHSSRLSLVLGAGTLAALLAFVVLTIPGWWKSETRIVVETSKTARAPSSSQLREAPEAGPARTVTAETHPMPTNTMPEESPARLAGSVPTEAVGRNTAIESPSSAPISPAPVAMPPRGTVTDSQVRGSMTRRLSSEEIALLVKRGEDFLAAGDIPAARLVLQRAAEARDPRAALVLGTTYDSIVLEELGFRGPTPDIAVAQTWYERAKEFGSTEATRRLEMLVSRGQEQQGR